MWDLTVAIVSFFYQLTISNEQLTLNKNMEGNKKNPLFIKADFFAKEVYRISQTFPSHEVYGITSQLRRASLSVVLNIIEGFARNNPKEFRRFLLISFGSLKEAKYLLSFSKDMTYIEVAAYEKIYLLSEEIAKIIWTVVYPKK